MTIAALVASGPLRMGASGPGVREAQLALKSRGYPLSGTGYYGGQTDTAVEDLQRKLGLPVTGEIDLRTAQALDAAVPPPTATPTPLWLSVSLAHLGLKEGPGAKNNPELVADIRTVAKDYQSDATPWCAGWVSFCLSKAGFKPSSQPLWALSYATGWGIKLRGPAVGAIAVKTRRGGGHVTIVAGRTRGGALACCGGNQNDQVSVAPYAEIAFVGFYWPKYAPMPDKVGFSHLPVVTTAGKPVSSES